MLFALSLQIEFIYSRLEKSTRARLPLFAFEWWCGRAVLSARDAAPAFKGCASLSTLGFCVIREYMWCGRDDKRSITLASTRAHNATRSSTAVAAAAKSASAAPTERESTPPLRSQPFWRIICDTSLTTYFAARTPKSNCHVTLKTCRLDIKLLKQPKNMHLLKIYPRKAWISIRPSKSCLTFFILRNVDWIARAISKNFLLKSFLLTMNMLWTIFWGKKSNKTLQRFTLN